MSIKEECIYLKDGICIDGQECKYNSVSIRNAACFVSRWTLTDCRHFRRDKPPCKQCTVLIPNKSGHVQCSVCRLNKNGNRIICSFYDKEVKQNVE